MASVLILILSLIVTGCSLIIAGVYLLLGIGSALVAAGVFALMAAAMLRFGVAVNE
jgi:hypothetical protein